MDIPVNRIKPYVGGNSLAWSEDGDLAIVAVPNVIVYSAKDYVEGKQLEFTRSELANPENSEYNHDIDPHSSINQIDPASPVVTRAAWSPSGMSASGGCFLTVLTNKHQLLIFDSAGAPGDWTLLLDLSPELPEVTAIKCFDWQRVDDGSVWGYSLLSVGTDSGVYIFKVRGGKFDYTERYQIAHCRMVKYALEGTELYVQTPGQLIEQQTGDTWPLGDGHISALHVDETGVLVAQPGIVTHLPSGKQFTLPYLESTVGFLGSCGKWASVSYKGNVYIHNDFETSLQQYFTAKRASSQLTVLGLAPSADKSSFAVSYSARPLDGLFFPSLKFKTIVISLQSLTAPDFAHTRMSPRAHWASTYLARASLPSFNDVSPPHELESLEQLLTDPNLAKMRLETYFGVKDHTPAIRKIIAKILLQSFTGKGKNNKNNPIDQAILVSYTKYEDHPEIACPDVVEVSGKELTELFTFKSQIANLAIESKSEHIWRRCDVTLLPILSMDTLSSTNNQFQILAEDAGELNDSFISKQLLSLPFCLFNGCRFYRKVVY